MQALATISDKWVDPESDSIGAELHPRIELAIDSLRKELQTALPDGAATLQQWASLRIVAPCARRAMHRQRLNPSPLKRLWQKIVALTGTLHG